MYRYTCDLCANVWQQLPPHVSNDNTTGVSKKRRVLREYKCSKCCMRKLPNHALVCPGFPIVRVVPGTQNT
jgi:hypothetical protein